jgi:GxxExxY protein
VVKKCVVSTKSGPSARGTSGNYRILNVCRLFFTTKARRHEGPKVFATLIDTEPYLRRIIGCAIEVHKTFGPGLTGSVYEAALCRELDIAKPRYTRQQKLPVIDTGDPLDIDFRMDLVVEDAVVVELKSVQALLPVPEAQSTLISKSASSRLVCC